MLADRLWPVLIIGGATTLLWLAIITSGAGGDSSVYLLPLTMAGGGAVALMLTKAASRGHTALLLVLITALTVINYRVRGEPENAIERDVQNMIKVAVWGCMLIPALINWRDIVPYFRDPRFGLYLIFIALSLASTAWSIDPLMTVVSASGLLVYLIFGCLLAEVFTTRALVNAMVWSLVGYGVANWLFSAFAPTTAFLEGTMRLQGFTGHPNFLGSQTSVLLCLLIAAYYRGYIGRFWFWILLAFAVITLMATQSRTSGLSVFLAFVACRYRRLFFAVVLFALTCLTLIVITGYLDQLISNLFDRATATRWRAGWTSGITWSRRSPTGHGLAMASISSSASTNLTIPTCSTQCWHIGGRHRSRRIPTTAIWKSYSAAASSQRFRSSHGLGCYCGTGIAILICCETC